jgi:hypothetical protein
MRMDGEARPMPTEPEPCADLSARPSVEPVYALTVRQCEPLTFEQAFDLYAPPVHEPELLDDPECELFFLRVGTLKASDAEPFVGT